MPGARPVTAGYATGAWNTGNTYANFTTAPQIYNPTAPLGSRWTGLLVDLGHPPRLPQRRSAHRLSRGDVSARRLHWPFEQCLWSCRCRPMC